MATQHIETYALVHDLPVRLRTRVDRLEGRAQWPEPGHQPFRPGSRADRAFVPVFASSRATYSPGALRWAAG